MLKLLESKGLGRTVVMLFEERSPLALGLYEKFGTGRKLLLIKSDRVTVNNWMELTQHLLRLLNEQGIRQASFICFDDSAVLVQNLALHDPRLVRTVVCLNPSTGPHPSLWLQLLSKIEHYLPLGLPFRKENKAFDSNPFLHRIRCPVLLITNENISAHQELQTRQMSLGLPNVWQVHLNVNRPIEQLLEVIKQFQDIPAKCPQKNVYAASPEPRA